MPNLMLNSGTAELKKFFTSHYIYAAVRVASAILIPSIILAHFGLLKEYFLFPLGTSFVGLTDNPGPFIRRRNALILAILSFTFVALTASLLKDFQPLVYLEIVVFGMFFTIIGVYGQRFASVGSLSLVVLGIFIDGHLTGSDIFKSLLIFFAGCVWFFLVFLVVSRLQPYKLAGQMVGENYLELAKYLKIKAKFYEKNPDFSQLFSDMISQQVKIKELQETTRETVFRTRKIVNESTTTSRILMLLFLNSIDLHEKLMTSENDYQKLQNYFGEEEILQRIHGYLMDLSDEISNIGIALQTGTKAKPNFDLNAGLQSVYEDYFNLRNAKISSDTLENFMILRQIFARISEITEEINGIFTIFSQDVKLAKSLSTGLDLKKFLPHEEKLNRKVLLDTLSLKSYQFRHAIRITVALLLGYFISKFEILGIGHSYWILITITAILKPAYSITKSRNILRIYGTITGAVTAYILIFTLPNIALFVILLSATVLYISLLKENYFWAVFFMTIYIFLSFNFLNPGHVNLIFKDRLLDTAIAGIIAFAVSSLVFPVWEHTKNRDLMVKSAQANFDYFKIVIARFLNSKISTEDYKLKRKTAVIDLANLSENFQKMLSEPKKQRKKLQAVHQFVNTSHLITAYTASLSQYEKTGFAEIDFENWEKKISAEFQRILLLLKEEKIPADIASQSKLLPDDDVENLLNKRKNEIEEDLFYDRRDPKSVTHLTELKNIRALLELIYDVAKEQRKVLQDYFKTA